MRSDRRRRFCLAAFLLVASSVTSAATPRQGRSPPRPANRSRPLAGRRPDRGRQDRGGRPTFPGGGPRPAWRRDDRSRRRHTPPGPHRQPHPPAARRRHAPRGRGRAPLQRPLRPGLLLAIAAMSPSERVLRGAEAAREDLESGFTTVRNLGHSGVDGDVALRNAIDAGRVPGPRILACGRKLSGTGSYMENLNPALFDTILDAGVPPFRRPRRRAPGRSRERALRRRRHQDRGRGRRHRRRDGGARGGGAPRGTEGRGPREDAAEHPDRARRGRRLDRARRRDHRRAAPAMRAKGIFLDVTETFYGGRLMRSRRPTS